MFNTKNTQNTIQERSKRALLYGVFSILFTTLFFVASDHAVLALSDSAQSTNVPQSIDFLKDAQKSMEMMQWEEAQYAAKEYLHHNIDSQSRWSAWNIIVDALQNNEKYDEALSVIDDMSYEYAGIHAYEQAIALKKALLLECLQRYDDAIAIYATLEQKHYASTPDSPYYLTPIEQGRIQYRLAQLFILDQNILAAEEKLRACIALEALSINQRVECAYALAQLHAANNKEYEAQELLRQLWSIRNTPRSLRANIGFLLADIYEYRGKKSQARAMFESLRGIYPNQAVLDMRLKLLK